MMTDLQADETEKLRYESMSIDKFWLGMDERHELQISHYVTKHLVKFGAMHLRLRGSIFYNAGHQVEISNPHY